MQSDETEAKKAGSVFPLGSLNSARDGLEQGINEDDLVVLYD